MSRHEQVKYFNMRQLNFIKSEGNAWDALVSVRKLRYFDADRVYPRATQILQDLETHKASVKNDRLPTTLVLKVCAKVVLLSNLHPEGGLANGSQGEAPKFVDTRKWLAKELEGKGMKRWGVEQAKIGEFQTSQYFLCPIAQFTSSEIVTIRSIVQSLRGSSYDRYLVSQSQILLALALALSIHKSQGMALDHVEVSCPLGGSGAIQDGRVFEVLPRGDISGLKKGG